MSVGRFAFALMVAALSLTTAAQAGNWRYHEDRNDGHILQYQEDGQTIFELACGRGFALLARHPAQSRTEGKARITLSSSGGKMNFDGEYVPPFESAMNFRQTYLGYSKQDPVVYGTKWQQLESRLLDVLDTRDSIAIASGKNSYHLPPIDIDKWRKPFDLCGYGLWVSPRDFPAETP